MYYRLHILNSLQLIRLFYSAAVSLSLFLDLSRSPPFPGTHCTPLPSPLSFTRKELLHKINLCLSSSSYFLCYCFFFTPVLLLFIDQPFEWCCLLCWPYHIPPLFLMAELNLQPAAAATATADESVSATSSGSKRLADSLRTSRLAPSSPPPSTYPLSRLLAGSLIKSPYMIPLAKGQNPSQYHYFVIKQMPPASVTILCLLTCLHLRALAQLSLPRCFHIFRGTQQKTLRCFVSIQLFYSQASEAVKVNIIFRESFKFQVPFMSMNHV